MMRLYDFECVECQHKFEHLHRDGEDTHCPICNSMLVEKLPSIVNINMGPTGAYGYHDETLGTYISTNAQRKEEMRKAGVTEKGDTPKPHGGAWV